MDAISGATISFNALVDDLNSFEGFIEQIKEMHELRQGTYNMT